MAIFKGAGVAIVTPMYEDGKVNYDKLEELLEYQLSLIHISEPTRPHQSRFPASG